MYFVNTQERFVVLYSIPEHQLRFMAMYNDSWPHFCSNTLAILWYFVWTGPWAMLAAQFPLPVKDIYSILVFCLFCFQGALRSYDTISFFQWHLCCYLKMTSWVRNGAEFQTWLWMSKVALCVEGSFPSLLLLLLLEVWTRLDIFIMGKRGYREIL